MVGVETCAQSGTAQLASTRGDPSKDAVLTVTEEASHFCTQYSVSWISRTGRFAGGFSTACLLTRLTAVA